MAKLRRFNPVAGAALALAALPLAANAQAATTSSTFNVTITILKQCAVTAPATIALGSANASDLLVTPASSTQTFTILCSKGTPYTVGFSSVNDLTAGSPIHRMKGSGGNTDVVAYNLLDVTSGAANALPLSAATSVIADAGTGASQSKTLKALVVNYTTSLTPDTYSDTVTMTVTY